MRRSPSLAGLLGVALVAGACATVAPAPAPPEPQRPAEVTPSPPPTQQPPQPTRRQQMAAAHRERAGALEGQGRLRRALDEWKIALTIDPEDQLARVGRARLEARIEEQVAARINEGRAALARGAQFEARKSFLTALALDPTNKAAFGALQDEVRDIAFVTHTVRAGETLASIAQRYYGDQSRLEVIWETNNLPPNPRLAPGTALKIPEIPGLPFPRPEVPRRDPLPGPGVAAVPPPAEPAAPRPEPPRDEPPPEMNPLLVDAREALDRQDFAGALADIDRLLASTPGHREGLDLKKLVLYRQGKIYFDQKKYDESYRTLGTLAKLDAGYEDTAALLSLARRRVADRHYGEGIRLYREEKVREAIAEWKVVLDVDPQHTNARRNIEQAERLLRGLEQRKR